MPKHLEEVQCMYCAFLISCTVYTTLFKCSVLTTLCASAFFLLICMIKSTCTFTQHLYIVHLYTMFSCLPLHCTWPWLALAAGQFITHFMWSKAMRMHLHIVSYPNSKREILLSPFSRKESSPVQQSAGWWPMHIVGGLRNNQQSAGWWPMHIVGG